MNRAKLIEQLYQLGCAGFPVCTEAADMLEADGKPLTEGEAKRLWCACKSISNEDFCIEFTRAVEAHIRGEKRC